MAMDKRIAFDRSLYVLEAVEAAASAYAEHAEVKLSPNAEAVDVTISVAAGDDLEAVAHAFCNHVLYETIARKRGAALQEVG